MLKIPCLILLLLAFGALFDVASAADDPASGGQQAKELTGMSIVGNDEAPKSLYIVPWKCSEIGVETSLDMMLDKDAVPLDRDVFKRQLDYYHVRQANRSGRTD